MNKSYPFDPDLHEEGSVARAGRCSYHQAAGGPSGECRGEAVVSYRDDEGRWQSGCARALEQLVEAGRIEPLGQGG